MTPPNTLTMLSEFAKGGGSKAFTGMAVTHAEFAAQVRSRIERPYEIYQGNASLCGPAAFMYCLIKKNAMAYAKYAMDLFATGTAWLGHLHIKPSADCKRSAGESLLAVDWVTLAGLRDSENSLLEYDSPTDRVAGITNARTQAGWLGRCGYFAAVARETNAMRDKPLSALLRVQQHRSAGSHPCLLIGANVVTGTARGRAFPNHWVVLGSEYPFTPPTFLVERGSTDGSGRDLSVA